MPPAPFLILYDAECSLCQATRSGIVAADHTGTLAFLPLQDPSVAERFPQLLPWQIRKRIHLITPNGQAFVGPHALREIGRVISPRSGLGFLLKLFYFATWIPGILPLAEWAYDWVAEKRTRFNGGRH